MNGLTRHQVAEILGVSDQTVSNYCNEGLLGSWRGKGNVLYVNSEDVERYKGQLRMIAADERLIAIKGKKLEEERAAIDREDMRLRKVITVRHADDYNKDLSSLVKNLYESGIVYMRGREKDVLCAFIDGENTRELSERYNLSVQRIYQILNKALERFGDVNDIRESWKFYGEMENKIEDLQKENEMLKKKLSPEDYYEMSDYLKSLLKTRLVDLGLSVRAMNVMKSFRGENGRGARCPIETLGELITCPGGKLAILSQQNCGKKTFYEFVDIVESLGLFFKFSTEDEMPFYRRLDRHMRERSVL